MVDHSLILTGEWLIFDMFIRVCFLLFFTYELLPAQLYLAQQTRHRFAQMHVGVDLASNLGGRVTYLDHQGRLRQQDIASALVPRLVIGGTHFWGHADFYVAIPLRYPTRRFNGQEVTAARGVETAFKYYPWRMQYGRVRPFVGVALTTFSLQQRNGSLEFPDGPERNRVGWPLLAGSTLQLPAHLFELTVAWNYRNQTEYYLARDLVRPATLPPLYLTASWRYFFDTTLGAERPWANGTTAAQTRERAANGGLNGLYAGVGISSVFWLHPSDYNRQERPYLDRPGNSRTPDFTLGYYHHRADLNVSLNYRSYRASLTGYGAEQTLQRRSWVLEATKFLGDYHGFAPFLGPAVSRERLHFRESFEELPTLNVTDRTLHYGLTFGWDIRPNRLQSWYLRTNLRWFPRLELDVREGQTVRFDALEFNFIQLVVFPGRF